MHLHINFKEVNCVTVKQKLQRYANELEYVKELEEKLAVYRSRMTSISSMRYDDIAKGISINDKICEAVTKLIELEEDYLDRICKLADLEIEMNSLMNELDSKEQKLIRLRYIKCEKWEDICVAMNYSWRGIHNLHRRILEKLEKSA